MNNIYPYEYRKIDKKFENDRLKVMIDDINTIISGYNQFEKKISDQIKGKKYNAFLFFNEVNEMFSKILIEEHLYDMDVKNKNKNIIIYFGENEYIKKSFDRLYKKSKATMPFLIIIKNILNYNEELKFVNYIPNINSIKKLLMSESHKYNRHQRKSMCEKALFNFIITK